MKLKSARETEVFVNSRGYLAIKQVTDDNPYTEFEVIELNPEQADLVAREITNLLKSKQEWWSPQSEDVSDLAAAE